MFRKHRILFAAMLSTGLLTAAGAQADPLDFSLNLGGPGYSVGFSNYPQYYYLAPPQPYVSWYSPPLYAQYELWYYYPQIYYEYYPAPPPPPPQEVIATDAMLSPVIKEASFTFFISPPYS